jgi:hypothetical protein
MHHIALRTASARVNGFDSIKGVSTFFLWYNESRFAESRVLRYKMVQRNMRMDRAAR